MRRAFPLYDNMLRTFDFRLLRHIGWGGLFRHTDKNKLEISRTLYDHHMMPSLHDQQRTPYDHDNNRHHVWTLLYALLLTSLLDCMPSHDCDHMFKNGRASPVDNTIPNGSQDAENLSFPNYGGVYGKDGPNNMN